MAEEVKDQEKEQEKSKTTSSPNSKEKEFYKDTEDKITIMPTMIDESEDTSEKRKDLSAIIPKNNFDETPHVPNGLVLTSREKELKSDGSIIIARIDDNIDIKSFESELEYPAQIDMEQRKIENQKNKNKGRRKEKKKKNLKAMKFQNTMALVSLVVIIFLAGFGYYVYNKKTDKDFVVLTVTVELGEDLPIRKSSYVKPGVGNTIDDELLYVLDLTEVKPDIVGSYPYKVTYNGIVKKGTINVVDKTGPNLEVREKVTITEGQTYTAATFVKDCKDPSNCNFTFQDAETVSKYTTPGTYVLFVVATDAYNNSTTKQVRLIIEAKGDVKKYTKKTTFDFTLGYETTETYDLHFQQLDDYSLLIDGTYTKSMRYSDLATYKEARKTYYGEVNYTCDDDLMTITLVEPVDLIGGKYSRLEQIEKYMKDNGYKESD